MTLDELYLRFCMASYDRQLYLHAMVGKQSWYFELDRGVLQFTQPHQDPLELNVQVIGTESFERRTWLWAWANDASGIPPGLLKTARDLRALGERDAIAELCTAELPLSRSANGERITAVAAGVGRAGASFRCEYPAGALYVIIKDARLKRVVNKPLERIARVVPRFLTEHWVSDHRTAYLHYLRFYRLDVEESGARVTARHRDFPPLTAEFDARRRLVRLDRAD